VAAISYDAPVILREFAARRGITFPLLADPASAAIARFGLRQEHGQAYATTFVTDAAGVIRAKNQEESIVYRRTGASILLAEGAAPAGTASAQETPYFVLRTTPSNDVVGPGQRVTLALDFEMKPGLHAYAPGPHSYRPLSVAFDAHPRVRATPPAVFPEPKPYLFRPLNETVPVHEGSFRVLQDVVMNDVPVGWAQELLDAAPDRFEPVDLTGTLSYQVCSDTTCYPPVTLPLRVSLKLRPKDEIRARPELRRPEAP
jgi:Disulphide bond corrector protein DsbC/AhpC/TSA family